MSVNERSHDPEKNQSELKTGAGSPDAAVARRHQPTMHLPAVAALALCALAAAAPVTYDQHQRGDINVRADLQNLVFVAVIPKNEIEASSNLLLNAVSNLSRRQNHNRHHHDSAELQDRADVGAIEAFIEPESTYKVDITGSKAEAETQPEPEVVLIENKPPAQSAVKIIEVIEGDENQPSQIFEDVKLSNDGIQKVEHLPALVKDEVEEAKATDETEVSEPKSLALRDENVPETLILVGDAIEQCGPLGRRDQKGVCQFASDLQKSESANDNE